MKQLISGVAEYFSAAKKEQRKEHISRTRAKMKQIRLAISDHLSAVREAYSRDHAKRTRIRYVGGTRVVLEKANGNKMLLDINMLRLMSKRMREESKRQQTEFSKMMNETPEQDIPLNPAPRHQIKNSPHPLF